MAQLQSTGITGSLTVTTGSATELLVTNTGVRIGNIISDTHTVTGSLNISGSLGTVGTITATTLIVQTITSSVATVTGSTKFGIVTSNTHQFTGSVDISGSLATNGAISTNSTISSTSSITASVVTTTGGGIIVPGGNIGVGTSAIPLARIHISSSTGNPLRIDATGPGSVMFVSASGNIGIGTLTPTLARLQIQGNVSASSYTGSLFGTASRADNATSASFASTAATATTATTATSALTASSGDAFYVRTSLGIARTPAANEEIAIDVPLNQYAISLYSGSNQNYGLHTNLGIFTLQSLSSSGAFFFQNANVGIGTSTTQNVLHVHGTSDGLGYIRITDSVTGTTASDGVRIGYNSGVLRLQNYENSDIQFLTNNTTEAIRIKSDGNVGIGTTAPNYRFTVGNSAGNSAVHIGGGNSNTIPALSMQSDFVAWSSSQNGFAYYYNATNGNLDLYRKDNSVTESQVMTWVRASGNVGIGTTSPSLARLQVQGNVSASSYTGSLFGTASFAVSASWAPGGASLSGGSTNYVARWASSTTLTTGSLFDNGTSVGIGTTSPYSVLDIQSRNTSWGESITIFPSSVGYGTIAFRLTGSGMSSTTGTWAIGKQSSTDGTTTIEYFQILRNGLTGGPLYRADALQVFNPDGNSSFGFNVGIGTTTVSYPLHVRRATVYHVTAEQSSTNTGDANAYATFYVVNNATSSGTVRGYFGGGGSGVGNTSMRNHVYVGAQSNHGMRFFTNDSAKVTIDTSGNVGIGSLTPSALLDVGGGTGNPLSTQFRAVIKGTSGRTLYLDSDSGGASMWWGSGTTPQFAIDSSNGGGAAFWTHAGGAWSSRMTINSDGNVGIGTTSPSARLSIIPGGSYPTLRVNNSSGGADGEIFQRWAYVDASNDYYLDLKQTVTSGVVRYNFSMVNATTAYNDVLVLDRGNVGIGTTSPGFKLDVYGDARFGDGNNFNPLIQFAGSGRAAGSPGYSFVGDLDTGMYNPNLGNTLAFSTAGSERMRITSDGSIGIGTTAPTGALHVTTFGQYSYFSSNANGAYPANIQGISFGWNASAGGGETIIAYNKGAGSPGGLVFANNDGGSYAERMRITSGGSVGIGTTLPLTKLHVVGSISAEYSDSIYLDYSPSAGSYKKGFSGLNQSSGTARGLHIFNYDNDSSQGINFWVGTNASRTQAAIITNAGIVGIGTSSPTGHQLDIASSQGNADNSAIRAKYPSGGGLANTEFGALAYRNGVWAAVYGKQGSASSAGYFDGNVGIGTASPTYTLSVVSTTTAAAVQSIRNTSNSGYSGIHFISASGTLIGHIGYGNTSTSAWANQFFIGSITSVPVVFSIADSERVRIDTNGNVGISTSSPQARLHIGPVNGDTAAHLYLASNNNSYGWRIDTQDSGAGVVPLRIWRRTAGSDTQVITVNNADGNVGIGTTAPVGILNIVGGDLRGVVFGPSTGSIGTLQLTNKSPGSPVSGRLMFGTDGTGWQFRIAQNQAGSITDLVTVLTGGNVGIGTTDPIARLVVVGQGTGQGLIGNAGFTSNYTGISLNGTLSTSAYNILSSPTEQTLYINRPSGVAIRFREANGGDQMTIATGGNVGINTTTPATKLNVKEDNTGTEGFIITNWNSVNTIKLGSDSSTGGGKLSLITNGGATNVFVSSYASSYFNGGNVGIGTTAPSVKLHVNGTSYIGTMSAYAPAAHIRGAFFGGPRLQVYGLDADANAWMGLGTDMSSGAYEFNIYYSTNAASSVCFGRYDGTATQYGGFTATARLSNGGNWTVAGDVIAYGSPSDITLKTNIKPLEGALEKIMKLQGVSFTWKEGNDISKLAGLKDDIGFIAQEVQEVLPELVRKNDNGLLSLRDKGIIPLLVESIKELKAEIEELKRNK